MAYWLESGKPLSASVMWELQRRYFAAAGPGAWSGGTVPHYITSNPFMAGAFAAVIAGYMRDWLERPDRDPEARLYIVELGTGSGRFSYHLLRELARLCALPPLRQVRYTYVMTDFAESNVAFWERHDKLAPFVASGTLDFAMFDAQHDDTIVLRGSGAAIAGGTPGDSLVVIAGYVFDSIPHDAFVIENEQLFECLVSVSSEAEEADPRDPALLSRLEAEFDLEPLPADAAEQYYDSEAANRVLHSYAAQFANLSFTLPIAAMRCVEKLLRLGDGRLLLLAADKGAVDKRSLEGMALPAIIKHGSISMNVNFHALGRFAGLLGGEMLHTEGGYHAHIGVVGLLHGRPGDPLAQTRFAFGETIAQFGPDDYYTLREAIKSDYAKLTGEQLLAYARWTKWDAKSFLDYFPHLFARIEQEQGSFPVVAWRRATIELWDNYYPIGEKEHLALYIGMLLYALDEEREAIAYLQLALRHYGPDVKIYYYLGSCHYYLEEWEEAEHCALLALELDPQQGTVIGLLERIRQRS
ncbi:SAM-dependent methyltransferase [Paenibacillus cymbidii]|uniref:SAM-dependent methyltransferase n=1 Tax=Paenibacillus cymbidii TaxID=1639034 RepID=UPI001080A362|nr:SAM-dependent methyltransferase [Paenibacillus cymbidii]